MGGLVAIYPDDLANPTRLALAQLECAMIWPDDSSARAEAFKTCSVEHALADGSMRVPLSLAIEAKNATPLPLIWETAKPRVRAGNHVGEILLRALIGQSLSDAMKSVSLEFDVAKSKNPTFLHGRYASGSTLNAIWSQFRPVSHFWAAYVYRILASDAPEPVFPCTVAQFPKFLQWAESLRLASEIKRGKHSKKYSILVPGETFTLPSETAAALGALPAAVP